jgi:hypothetical protein
MAFFLAGKHAGHSFQKIAAEDRRYSAWALRLEREDGGKLSRNLAAFVKYVRALHGGVMSIGKHRGLYFNELLSNDPAYVEWCQGLSSPGNVLKDLAAYAKEQGEAGAKKRKRDETEACIKTCVICLERPLSACWIPCGHATTCYRCALEVANGLCPICRKKGAIQRLFVG